MNQVLLCFVYYIIVSIYDTVFLIVIFPGANVEDTEVFRNYFIGIKLYLISFTIMSNHHVPKIFYIILNNERVNYVWIRFLIQNMHVLQLGVLKNVFKEAAAFFRIVIVNTNSPAQALHGNNVILLVTFSLLCR